MAGRTSKRRRRSIRRCVSVNHSARHQNRLSYMKTIWTIARRELGAYFSSPVAYVFIVIFLLLTGFFTFMVGRFFERGTADLLPFFVWHPWLYLFLVPPWQAILGKFLASWFFLLIALLLTFPMVVTVAYLGHPDLGRILSGYAG